MSKKSRSRRREIENLLQSLDSDDENSSKIALAITCLFDLYKSNPELPVHQQIVRGLLLNVLNQAKGLSEISNQQIAVVREIVLCLNSPYDELDALAERIMDAGFNLINLDLADV